MSRGKERDHAGAMCDGKEMMKAWDGPGGHADKEERGEMREAKKVAGTGGMKHEAGAHDPDELK